MLYPIQCYNTIWQPNKVTTTLTILVATVENKKVTKPFWSKYVIIIICSLSAHPQEKTVNSVILILDTLGIVFCSGAQSGSGLLLWKAKRLWHFSVVNWNVPLNVQINKVFDVMWLWGVLTQSRSYSGAWVAGWGWGGPSSGRGSGLCVCRLEAGGTLRRNVTTWLTIFQWPSSHCQNTYPL